MSWLLTLLLLATLPQTSGVHEMTLDVDGVGQVLYGVFVPRGYRADRPAPLVVVLHSGGQRMRHYGAAFTRFLAEPALRDLNAIMVAPDCPTAAWSDPAADRAVMAVVAEAMNGYNIDRRRILVTGYSMGGRGTWFQAARHPDLYTAAIPMAASTGDLPLEQLAAQPTYVIHSRADEVVPFAPAERTARQLEREGRPVRFEAMDGLRHFEMDLYIEALRRAGRWVEQRWNER